MMTKFATFEDAEVLDVKGSPTRLRSASLDKVSDYDAYRTGDGFMYVRLRAISSRVNKNHDGWPSVELAGGPEIFNRHAKQSSMGFTLAASEGSDKFGFATFLGKPNFIDHNNSDPDRARGVVVDAKLNVMPLSHLGSAGDDYWTGGLADPEHMPPTEVELLIEVDAKSFPKYAKSLLNGDIDGFSMGCDVEQSKCSHCGHVATNPTEYCAHILSKGALHDLKTADGKRTSRRSYENCYGIKFFEISAVFEPADETALKREIRAGVNEEEKIAWVQSPYADEVLEDPVPGRGRQDEERVEDRAMGIMDKAGANPDDALDMAIREHGQPQVPGEGAVPEAKRWQYQQKGLNMEGLPEGTGPVERERPPDVNPEFWNEAQEMLDQEYPRRPVMNDPRWSKVKTATTHTAENPLPQSFETTAPEEVDTLRQEHICPVCGENMEGETCDVCGYVEPPKGFDNPDLQKAKEIHEQMEQADQEATQNPGQMEQGMQSPLDGQPPKGNEPFGAPGGGAPGGKPGGTRNPHLTGAVMSEMRWQPKINSKLAGRINTVERPIKPDNTPASNEPANVQVIKSPKAPVTSAMRTAQDMIQAHNQGDIMSTKTADGPTGPEAAPDVRTDVTGVGGVMDASNEAASAADAQVDVLGIGSTGVTDVEADSTETLPTADEKGDSAGFDDSKTTDDSGPTTTFGDSDGTQKGVSDPVTDKAYPQDADVYKGSSTQGVYASTPFFAGDDAPFVDEPGLSGGSANQGTQPSDPVGKPDHSLHGERVDVLKPTTTTQNNSGPTSQWTGTEGNAVERQQEPVTDESMALGGGGVGTDSPNWTSHVVSCLKLADLEVDLGLTPKAEKYNRLAELEVQSDEEITATYKTLAKVRTAGLAKLAQQRKIAGAGRVPALFSEHTASPDGTSRVELSDSAPTGTEHIAAVDDELSDSALFSF